MTALTVLVGGGVAIVLLLAISAFFSSSEIATFSTSPEWVSEQAATGDERASRLDALRSDLHRLLVTILVGNNVVNVAISSILTVLVAQSFSGGIAVTIATVLASALVLVCGESSRNLRAGQRRGVVGPLGVVEMALPARDRLRRGHPSYRRAAGGQPAHRRVLHRRLTATGPNGSVELTIPLKYRNRFATVG
jgi:hypothetical protein